MRLICELANIELLVRDLPATQDWLSPSETRRFDSFSHPQRRRSFLAGRQLARAVVARWPSLIQPGLLVDEQGCSRIEHQPGLFVSISHSGDWVACAIADAPIGVDIENLSRIRDFEALARMVHSPAQCRAIAEAAAQADSAQQFYQWWTLKEAWFKRQGRGLDLASMPSLDFESCDGQEMTAASFVLPDLGLVLAIDSPALTGCQSLEFGGARRQALWRLKSPTLAVD
ncbi:4'-phosphopantetheinyl transferase family protein [Roseateles oligotrophus]|uniref:4'-phosphopantetheinyl transferase superfamily protein n=1 Tax=Roseateles oligotrophus TaxID=1769250 RepID=A0ABT2YDF6_9BURK|nr:4'-phosphopantetheinyl transferase superfamily protein [Roseateles oligotrophus]MCV2368088.1 4'-phosphopantetheinyl transferase superfamily protein [Roseateles oligotrophus]